MKTNRSSNASEAGLLKGLIFGGLIGALIVGMAAWLGPLLIDSDLSQNRLVQQLAKAEENLTAWDLLALLAGVASALWFEVLKKSLRKTAIARDKRHRPLGPA